MWGEVLNITTTLWPAARTTIRHAAHYLISTNYKDQTRFSLSEGVVSLGQARGVGPLRQDCWYSVKTPWDNFQPVSPSWQLGHTSHLTPHSGPVSLVTCSTSQYWAVARSSLSSYLIPADFNYCRTRIYRNKPTVEPNKWEWGQHSALALGPLQNIPTNCF